MSIRRSRGCQPRTTVPALLGVAAIAQGAAAVDLTVSSIEINQSINTGTTTLVARNAVIVRVKVGVADSVVPVPNVDAELRVFADGVEIEGSPFFSSNGPFTAPVAPNVVNENDTLNFLCVPPQSSNVDFLVTVNPLGVVAESNYANNTAQLVDREFLCRKMVELAYVSVNYVPGGGEPPQDMVAPGVGDAFLRGIYKTGDWNYHRSPLGALTWTQNINNSNNTLLSTLLDIRNSQIPAAGFSKPEFIYGWLPGNPYSGNGQANGIPESSAFGNTEMSRFQRTFAHEVGHLWGLSHNSSTIATVGFDVLRQLEDPLGLDPVMPTTKKDVMYAGQITEAAWVKAGSYNDCINDDRSQCTSDSDGGDGAGGASDMDAGQRCIRVTGEYFHDQGTIVLLPSQRLDVAEPTVHDPAGDALISAYDAEGALLEGVQMKTGTARRSCHGDELLTRSSLYAILPETIGGRDIARITITDVRTSRVLASQIRSPGTPVGAITSITKAGTLAPQGGPAMPGVVDPDFEPLVGSVEIRWTAADPDGDPMSAMLLYSPDGGNRWVPLGVNLVPTVPGNEQSFVFDTANVPHSVGPNGIVKLRISDGLNVADGEFPVALAMGTGTPPDVHVISPNSGTTVPQYSSVVLQASGWDLDDELLPESSLTWESDLDGPLGAGRLFVANRLSPGLHTLTLTGVDSEGLTTSRQVTVNVAARSVRHADMNQDGIVDGADLGVLLGAWGESGGLGASDLNVDGIVDGADLAVLLGEWS